LLEVAAVLATELGTGSAQIMRAKMPDADLLRWLTVSVACIPVAITLNVTLVTVTKNPVASAKTYTKKGIGLVKPVAKSASKRKTA
jgi:hypothetical protein